MKTQDIYVKHITIRVPFIPRLKGYLYNVWCALTDFPPAKQSDMVECSKEEAEYTFSTDSFPMRYNSSEYEGQRTDVHNTASYVSGEGPKVKVKQPKDSY